jgi:hypothetical protein
LQQSGKPRKEVDVDANTEKLFGTKTRGRGGGCDTAPTEPVS